MSRAELDTALEMIKNKTSIRKTAKHLGVNESTLRFKLKKVGPVEDVEELPSTSFGRKCVLPDEDEANLAILMRLRAKWGFSLTGKDIQELAIQYIQYNKDLDTPLAEHMKKHGRFKDDCPGKDWIHNFQQRWRFPNNTLLSCNSASNPDIIYGFFDTLERLMKTLNVEERPECVWNVDEGIYDPSKEIISVGQKTGKITPRNSKEVYSIQAAVSAAGDVVKPLILFKGAYVMSEWSSENFKGDVSVTQNGAMTADIFDEWFRVFCEVVTARPLILVCDGHSSHLKYTTIKRVW